MELQEETEGNLKMQYIQRIGQIQFTNFKDPFNLQNYTGRRLIMSGRNIIFANDQNKIIIIDSDLKTVYIIQNISISLSEDKEKVRQNLNQKLIKWKGYKYVKQTSLYYGQFKYYIQNGTGILLKCINSYDKQTLFRLVNDEKQNEDKLYLYKGNFSHGIKHTGQQNKCQEKYFSFSIQNQPKVLIKLFGYYNHNNRHGVFKIDNDNNNNIIFYNNHIRKQYVGKYKYNDVKTTNKHFQVQFQKSCLKSFNHNEQISQKIINYFFRRIQYSNQCIPQRQKYYKLKVTELLKITWRINCQNKFKTRMLKVLNQFSKQTSILQHYKLILVPIGIIQNNFNHYILLGIQSKTYLKDFSQQKQFLPVTKKHNLQIYVLDSIKNINYEQQIYQWTQEVFLQNPRISSVFNLNTQNYKHLTTQTLNLPIQDNYSDCGIFTCLYGFILYLSIIKNQKINTLQLSDNINTIIIDFRKSLKQIIQKQQNSFVNIFRKIIIN